MGMIRSVLLASGFLVVFLLAARVSGGPDDKAQGGAPAKYLGAAKCKMCHIKAHRTWKEMRHAKAWDVLQAQYRTPTAKDTDGRACISCHVTGYGDAEHGGFVDPKTSADLLGVQCEACHGPGSKHADAARKLQARKMGFAPGQPTFIIRKTTKCADCHNVHVNHKKFAAKAGGG